MECFLKSPHHPFPVAKRFPGTEVPLTNMAPSRVNCCSFFISETSLIEMTAPTVEVLTPPFSFPENLLRALLRRFLFFSAFLFSTPRFYSRSPKLPGINKVPFLLFRFAPSAQLLHCFPESLFLSPIFVGFVSASGTPFCTPLPFPPLFFSLAAFVWFLFQNPSPAVERVFENGIGSPPFFLLRASPPFAGHWVFLKKR